MKNVTVSVPDSVYRSARIRAAERGTSVSALVADYLRTLADEAAEFQRLAALQHSITDGIGEFRAADRFQRDELHGRAVR
ncbi:MAG: hypothetical protein QM619_03025 [Micropruina sp.]|uniref:DUF6364 family protein n=1 Tax=Micropruina sp. TaxID=2737536 RepID=UPI0039E370F1